MNFVSKSLAGAFVALTAMPAGAATFSLTGGNDFGWGTGSYSAGPCTVASSCYNPAGAGAGLAQDLTVFDASHSGSLSIDGPATVSVTFMGKEAGWTNSARIGGSSISTAGGATSFSASVVGGVLDFVFSSLQGGTIASAGGGIIGDAAIAFSAIFNGGKSIYAFFDDSGAASDRDFDDMVVRIDLFDVIVEQQAAIRLAEIPAVPVPASGLLLVGALAGFGALRRRKAA